MNYNKINFFLIIIIEIMLYLRFEINVVEGSKYINIMIYYNAI